MASKLLFHVSALALLLSANNGFVSAQAQEPTASPTMTFAPTFLTYAPTITSEPTVITESPTQSPTVSSVASKTITDAEADTGDQATSTTANTGDVASVESVDEESVEDPASEESVETAEEFVQDPVSEESVEEESVEDPASEESVESAEEFLQDPVSEESVEEESVEDPASEESAEEFVQDPVSEASAEDPASEESVDLPSESSDEDQSAGPATITVAEPEPLVLGKVNPLNNGGELRSQITYLRGALFRASTVTRGRPGQTYRPNSIFV